MAETTERTEMSKKGISDPFKEFKIVGFSGSVEDWPKWSKKFMAAGKLKKFAGLIDGSVTVPELTDNMNEKDQYQRQRDDSSNIESNAKYLRE